MLSKEGKRIVIDFEDAFLGIKGYDYLYWLTFFTNRKYYSKEIFLKSGLPSEMIEAVLTMILIVKSAISFYSESYKTNSMTTQERIEKIFSII